MKPEVVHEMLILTEKLKAYRAELQVTTQVPATLNVTPGWFDIVLGTEYVNQDDLGPPDSFKYYISVNSVDYDLHREAIDDIVDRCRKLLGYWKSKI